MIVRPGDHVFLRGWPGTLFVLDLLGHDRVQLLGQGGVRLIAHLSDVRPATVEAAA